MAQDEVTNRVVVIGGSAGSLDVLLSIIPSIAANSNSAFIIVLHRKADGENLLENLLRWRTTMPVREVEDKEPLCANTVYIAPADYHLLLEDKLSFSLDSSEKVHYSRPSIDVTFESVAEHFGDRAVGVLLSGANADGAAGLGKIKAAGGITIVQEPSSAEVAFMPQQAINRNTAMHVVPVASLADLINTILGVI